MTKAMQQEEEARMPDIYVVVWEIPYEGQVVCGAYLTKELAETRIAQLEVEREDNDYFGWIRCEFGQPVESSEDVGHWSIWNVRKVTATND